MDCTTAQNDYAQS